MEMSTRIGLFIIPIRFNHEIETYREYLDIAVEAERAGYTDIYIGEHLTDPREDIQSSIVFAAAILARTKRITINLSVLPLPHYNIKLLVKQLEDLFRLGGFGRVNIGFGKGALKGDLVYLNIDSESREALFEKNLLELMRVLGESDRFRNRTDSYELFSTLISAEPRGASNLISNGYCAVTSNFCHKSHYETHCKYIMNGLIVNPTLTTKKWGVGINYAPKAFMFESSRHAIENSLLYIFRKLQSVGLHTSMLQKGVDSSVMKVTGNFLFETLCTEQVLPFQLDLKAAYPNIFSHVIINLFDCITDPLYTDGILSLPKGIRDEQQHHRV